MDLFIWLIITVVIFSLIMSAYSTNKHFKMKEQEIKMEQERIELERKRLELEEMKV